jgi:hypothetical protein
MLIDREKKRPSGTKDRLKERLTLGEVQGRLTEYLQVTRSELIVAGFILCYCTFSVVLRIMESPNDPFDRKLRAEIQRRIDSAAAVRDSILFALPPGAPQRIFPSGPRNGAVSRKKHAPAEPMDINTASRDSLCLIPGIGPAIAQRIIDRRARKPFRSLRDLHTVKGIGPKLYAKISPHLRVVSPPKTRR